MDNLDEFYKLIIDDTAYEAKLTPKFFRRKKYIPSDPGKLNAIIPGVIRKIFVTKGQKIKRGDGLLILEAMKMKNTIASPVDGTIKEIYVRSGDTVSKGELLISFDVE